MRRHLKIGVATAPNGQKFGWVIEQTHRGIAFCPSGNEFFYKDFSIQSVWAPTFGCDILFVQGSTLKEDSFVFSIPNDFNMQKLRDAVRAYNSVDEVIEEQIKDIVKDYEIIE